MKAHIPNTITLLNLLSGTLAIVFAQAYPGDLITPILLIGLGAFFDLADGLVARALKVQSELGKQLDSLADLVTFGMAPAIVLYHLMLKELVPLPDMPKGLFSWNGLVFWTPLFLPLFSALRLAKFNIATNQQYSFSGMPTPANALFITSFVLTREINEASWSNVLYHSGIFYILLVALGCFLMVSRIRFMSFKLKSISIRQNKKQLIFVVSSITAILFLTSSALPLVILLYITTSLLPVN